jgi:predicted component of type VI protein secretion system
MSNFHATIKYNSGSDGTHRKGFYLQDIGSTNRTWLRLSAEGEVSSLHPLKINDIIKIGSTVFVVQSKDISNLKNMPIINNRNSGLQSQNQSSQQDRGNGLIA